MPQSVQRPFIPHHTPTKGRTPGSVSEFRVAKPFIPGAVGIAPEVLASEVMAVGSASSSMGLPGIEQFLQHERPATNAAAAVAGDSYISDFEEPDELPPVEHFLDPLPPVTQFSADDFPASEWSGGHGGDASSNARNEEVSQTDWLETDWQNYDWRAAAALGETGESEASSAWATTDWDAGAARPNPSRPNASRPTAAQAIASALDQIAERIRTGELVVPSPGTMSDPASIAASLAAMLGIRH